MLAPLSVPLITLQLSEFLHSRILRFPLPCNRTLIILRDNLQKTLIKSRPSSSSSCSEQPQKKGEGVSSKRHDYGSRSNPPPYKLTKGKSRGDRLVIFSSSGAIPRATPTPRRPHAIVISLLLLLLPIPTGHLTPSSSSTFSCRNNFPAPPHRQDCCFGLLEATDEEEEEEDDDDDDDDDDAVAGAEAIGVVVLADTTEAHK